MRHIFEREGTAALAEFSSTQVLLAFDFDGTLAPIVSERTSAEMRASTAKLFIRVCELFPTAVISGRSRSDLSQRLPGAAVRHVVGNHGLEPSPGMRALELAVAEMRPELAAQLHARGDVEIEDKRYSLAIHYRKSRAKRDARAAILQASATLRAKPRVVLGKSVISLLPDGAPNKGTALNALRVRENAANAIFVGDDVTDEDAFMLAESGRVLAIRVGRERTSAAHYFLRNQSEIDALLTRLVELRNKDF